MAETHVELNQFPVPRVGPRHSTQVLDIYILQGSVATYLRCGGTFNDRLLFMNLMVKEF